VSQDCIQNGARTVDPGSGHRLNTELRVGGTALLPGNRAILAHRVSLR